MRTAITTIPLVLIGTCWLYSAWACRLAQDRLLHWKGGTAVELDLRGAQYCAWTNQRLFTLEAN